MPVASVPLNTMSLPEFGEPTVMPRVERTTLEARIEARRAFMTDVLGIRLRPEVPPLLKHSGISPAVLAFTQQCDGCRKALIAFRPEMTYFRRT